VSEERTEKQANEESKDNSKGKNDDGLSHADSVKDLGEEEEYHPLSSEQFRSILGKVDALGLTWTADIPPLIKPKEPASREYLLSEEYLKIQSQYPHFPRELALVIFYTLTRSRKTASLIGSVEEAEQKSAAVQEYLIDARPEFRSEFFFKYAIKVPYFLDLDWEVVIKAYERNVRGMPRIPYALLSLVFRQPANPSLVADFGSETAERETLTVAVNEYLVDKLIQSLKDVKVALAKTRKMADSLSDQPLPDEESQHESSIAKRLE
jgi:hypothetical protein